MQWINVAYKMFIESNSFAEIIQWLPSLQFYYQAL